MHHIEKTSPFDKDFEDMATFVRRKGLRRWEDYSGGDDESRRHYNALRDHITIIEQACLSAYTEKPLGAAIHIDHFRKRTLYPALTFNYENLVGDDHNSNYGADFKDGSAHVNKDTFDGPERIFCPVSENLAEYVTFNVRGSMLPKSGLNENVTARVNNTIRVFNLNHPTLENIRARLVDDVRNYLANGIPDTEIKECLFGHGFPTVIEWALRMLG